MKQKKGFTIIELLTVMGVIAVLIGLLIPALGLVKDNAKRIQQKAQFHGIDVGLEIFKTEFGSYPNSSDNFYTGTEAVGYTGANKLAEAMVGLDLLGFHPNADFRSDGLNDVIAKDGTTIFGQQVYDTTQVAPAVWQSAEENLDARKGPFLDLESANAFRMDEVYATGGTSIFPGGFAANFTPPGVGGPYYPVVLCDVYARKRAGIGSKKTGTPVLYYRAHTNYKVQDHDNDNGGPTGAPDDDDIYSYYDNQSLLQLGMPDDGTPFALESTATPWVEFDNMIVNEQVQTVRRPFRADTYILISAGKDGDFGTADDIYNFDKEVTE